MQTDRAVVIVAISDVATVTAVVGVAALVVAAAALMEATTAITAGVVMTEATAVAIRCVIGHWLWRVWHISLNTGRYVAG